MYLTIQFNYNKYRLGDAPRVDTYLSNTGAKISCVIIISNFKTRNMVSKKYRCRRKILLKFLCSLIILVTVARYIKMEYDIAHRTSTYPLNVICFNLNLILMLHSLFSDECVHPYIYPPNDNIPCG